MPFESRSATRQGNCLQTNREFTIRDFLAFGQQYGIDYRFSEIDLSEEGARDLIIARGHIEETQLPSGFRFTHSELSLLHSYESVSLGHAPLLLVIVLRGGIRLSIGAVQRDLDAGMAATLQVQPEYALRALQSQDQELETLVLAFDPGERTAPAVEPDSLQPLLRGVRDPVVVWELPSFLPAVIGHSLRARLSKRQKTLLLEGLALQLTGYGLPEQVQPASLEGPSSARDHQRLERVRQLLEFAPAEDYSLADLATRAAMSPSGLRSKFRETYGLSVFAYLRRCRLNLGRQYLEQGYSVQQAAHRCGYRHATNFATAFRHHFGVTPRTVSR